MSITLFLTCLFLLLLVNFSLPLAKKPHQEIYVEVIPLDQTEEIKENRDNNAKSTNEAYNTLKKNKQFAQVHKIIPPPKDYHNPLLNKYKEKQNPKSKYKKSEGKSTAIANKELTAFNSVNDILARHSKANPENSEQESINKNSTISYSLINRTDIYIPVPVYLCETKGKIIINITVNSKGLVTKTSVNTSSTTKNACIINHAIEYAKASRFNTSKKTKQLGTITFNFKGKESML